jgi:hypothetical protein
MTTAWTQLAVPPLLAASYFDVGLFLVITGGLVAAIITYGRRELPGIAAIFPAAAAQALRSRIVFVTPLLAIPFALGVYFIDPDVRFFLHSEPATATVTHRSKGLRGRARWTDVTFRVTDPAGRVHEGSFMGRPDEPVAVGDPLPARYMPDASQPPRWDTGSTLARMPGTVLCVCAAAAVFTAFGLSVRWFFYPAPKPPADPGNP